MSVRALASSLLLAVLVLACEQNASTPPVDVVIVDATGDNPVDGLDGTITVKVRHMGELLTCDGAECASEIADGEYELRLPLETFEGINEAQIEIRSGSDRWIGATPPFQLFGEGVDLTGRLQLVAETPSTCAALSLHGYVNDRAPDISPARSHAAAVVRRNVALFAGGEDTSGPSDDVDRFDMLFFDADDLPTWDPSAIGAARGFALSEDRSLVVGDASSWLFEFVSLEQPAAQRVMVHEGAGFDSAIVDLDGSGAAIVGGSGSNGVTWIGFDGTNLGPSALAVRRDAPAAAAIGSGVLVVGGHADGEAAAEWLPRSGSGMELDLTGPPLPAGRSGVLFASPDGSDALWIGFEVGGAPSGQTFILRGCDAADGCVVEAGGAWPRPRTDFAFVITEAGTLWLVGGERDGAAVNEIDLVRWVGDDVSIEEGPSLASPRAGAAAFEHAFGIVTVAGGRSDALLEDAEMCFPAALDPI